MARLTALDPEQVTGKTKQLFEITKRRFGKVPNMDRTISNSPAALEAYMGFSSGLLHTSISPKLKELIAIAVAYETGCDYCNSAHSFFAHKSGYDEQTIEDARHFRSPDPKIQAALTFSKQIMTSKGAVADADLAAVKTAGYGEGEIIEIVAEVSLNIFTNYINIIADTDIDFPLLPPIKK